MLESVNTIHSAFFTVAEEYGNHVALVGSGGKGVSFTYSQFSAEVKKLAKLLQDSNQMDQIEVALLSENRPEWCIAYLAILSAGGTVVPIDANLKAEEIAYILKHSKARVVILSEQFESLVRSYDNTIHIICLEHVHEQNLSAPTELRPKNNETAALIYTSGTTGAPKAVELTHANILANLKGIAERLCFDHEDTFLSILPLHHTFECTCGFITPIMCGATIVYARSLKSRDIIEDIRNNKVTVMCGVPLLYEKMYHSMRKAINKAPYLRRVFFHVLFALSSVSWKLNIPLGQILFGSLRSKAGLNSLRMFVSGGAALPFHISRFFNLIGLCIIQGYGLTECSPVLSASSPDKLKFDSVGPVLSNIEVKIENRDDSGVGEIVVRGENITPGYRGNEEETKRLLRDGWLYTGDLGRIIDGQLYITGRSKAVIVSSAGKNIHPEEIEEKIQRSDLILETVVFGRVKEGKQGEEVVAIIVPDQDHPQVTEILKSVEKPLPALHNLIGEVVKEINTKSADYKRIVSFDIQLEELEKTSTRKIKRFLYK